MSRTVPHADLYAVTDHRRLLLVHAHPDDESSSTGATIARYCAEGAHVTLVTCTLGEEGEIIREDLSHVTPGAGLASHRLDELHAAAQALGLTDYVRLGGDGRYHDSGMAHAEDGTATARDETADTAFWNADLLEASLHLVSVLRDRRPQVVVSYDPFGMYGHPDHVMAHRVMTYACVLSGVDGYRPELGAPWRVSRTFWVTNGSEDMAAMMEVAKAAGIEEFWGEIDPDGPLPPMITRSEDVDVRVPVGPYRANKLAALRAHRSQVDLEDPFWKLMTDIETLGESFRLATGVPLPVRSTTDLFEGLELRP
ncbi:MAG TPA: N-acetyl-1-D-myo-inositol-2-amino-2-deoxy-alpha-D-glucopyranoside deacetylase [Propionibacteriaceae bacterium]|nr:N-acetyl-1-D-myo-inositol-2-amino-2-deoxy-alpha-D-glucopyranoside deacetylase [Propionibacteriaceae bacterium]